MSRARNPEQREAFDALRAQYPSGALLKVYRLFDDGRGPEWIPTANQGALHLASWDDLPQIESWLLNHPLMGPGYTYRVQVFTQDDNGRPSKAPQMALNPPKIVSPASVALGQAPQRLAEAKALAQMAVQSVESETSKVTQLTEETARAAAQIEELMSTQNPDPAQVAAAAANAANLQQQLRESLAGMTAGMQAVAQATRTAAAFGGAGAAPGAAAPLPPGVGPAGYIPQAVPGVGAYAMPGAPGGMPGFSAQPTMTPMGLMVPGIGLVPWSAVMQGGGAGSAVPSAAAEDIKALRQQVEAERQARLAAEAKAEREMERARHEAALVEERRRADDRFAAIQRENQAAIDRAMQASQAQLQVLQAQLQAAQARPAENQMAALMPMVQQMQAQAQASTQQMLQILASTKNDDASTQVRQAAAAMGEVMQTSMNAVQQIVRSQVAPPGSPQPAWLPLVMRAIDTVGGMGAALLTPPAAPQYAPPPQQMAPPPQQMQALPPAPPPQVLPAAVPAQAQSLPAGAPIPVAPPGVQPTAPTSPPQGAPEAVSANPEVVRAIDEARRELGARRPMTGINALQRAFDMDPELVRVGESYVTATRRLLSGYVEEGFLATLQEEVGKFPGMLDIRQPGQPWGSGVQAPQQDAANVIPMVPPGQAPAQA